MHRLLWGAAIVLVLAPVLLVPSAPTNDGPSHLYNAWIASQAERGAGVAAQPFRVERGIGQTLVSATALQYLGPVFGWDLAERIWLGALLLGLLLATVWYVRRSGAPDSPLLPVLLAWLSLSLVTAWGFYDFLLGVAVFAVLLGVLEDGPLPYVLGLLAFLFVVHLFVFVVGVGVVTVRAVGRRDLRPVVVTAGALGVAMILSSGVLAADLSMTGVDWGQRLLHLAFGNVLYSVSPAAILAGVVWTGLIAFGLLIGPWSWRSAVGLLFLLAALLAPAKIAGGSILFERVHLLALVCLAPAAAYGLSRLGRAPAAALGVVLVAGLGVTFAQWTGTADNLAADRAEIRSLLLEAGLPGKGRWIASALPHENLKVNRAPLHAHLVDRVAMDLQLVAADNHEAESPAFPVQWAGPNRTVRIRRSHDTLTVARGDADGVFVVHEPGAWFADSAGVTVASSRRFAVSFLVGPSGDSSRVAGKSQPHPDRETDSTPP